MSIKFFKLGLAFTHSCTSWVHASPSKSKALFIRKLRFLGYSHVQAHASPVIIYTKLAAFPSSKIFQIMDAFSTPLCHSAPIRPFGGVYPERIYTELRRSRRRVSRMGSRMGRRLLNSQLKTTSCTSPHVPHKAANNALPA